MATSADMRVSGLKIVRSNIGSANQHGEHSLAWSRRNLYHKTATSKDMMSSAAMLQFPMNRRLSITLIAKPGRLECNLLAEKTTIEVRKSERFPFEQGRTLRI